jgi:hypothetical protein
MTRNARFIDERITLKYGTGGGAMRALIEQVFAKGLGDVGEDGIGLGAMDDGAAIRIGDQYLVIATDSHVVQPIEFPGGDIGRLAVAGTVNDLAMMGATEPLAYRDRRHQGDGKRGARRLGAQHYRGRAHETLGVRRVSSAR